MKGEIRYKQRDEQQYTVIKYNTFLEYMSAVIKANVTGADEIIYNNTGLTYLGFVALQRGHSVYELDLKTYVIEKAKFSDVADETGGASKKKIVIRENCLYAPALNENSADKKFHKMLGVKYVKSGGKN